MKETLNISLKVLITYKKINTNMKTYNHFHNILRIFDVLANFPYTTSETMRDYYLQTG